MELEFLSKNELAELLGVHIRSICYHLKIKQGLKGYPVKMGKFKVKGKSYDLPKKYDKRTRVMFLKSEVMNYFEEDTSVKEAGF